MRVHYFFSLPNDDATLKTFLHDTELEIRLTDGPSDFSKNKPLMVGKVFALRGFTKSKFKTQEFSPRKSILKKNFSVGGGLGLSPRKPTTMQ